MFKATCYPNHRFWEVTLDYPSVDPKDRETLHLCQEDGEAFIRKHKKLYLLRAVQYYVEHKKKYMGTPGFITAPVKNRNQSGSLIIRSKV